MPLDWSDYDAFTWAAARQSPLPPGDRLDLADLVADILDLTPEVRATAWGGASPPGRFAATVVRVEAEALPAAWRDRVGDFAAVGVKVFRASPDAVREADRLLRFHQDRLHRLPGLPHPRVQRGFAAGRTRGRAWLLLEWMPGVGLDVWRAAPATLAVVRDLVGQLLGEIVLPLWSRGLVWWDFRDANCCVDLATGRLALLDVDSLAAYADEIIDRPGDWTRRDKGRVVAASRLRNMTARLLQAAGRRMTKDVRAAWDESVAAALATVGRPATLEDGRAAVARFLAARCLA